MESLRRLRFGLRAKLGLVALVLLALPLAGTLYVNEMERFLLEGQSGRSFSPALRGATKKSMRSCSACSARRLASGWWIAATT